MRTAPPRAATLLACAATLVLAACGGDKTVDDQQVEQGIEDSVTLAGVKVDKVSCPSDVTVSKGDTFDCSVSASNGTTATVVVTQEGGNRYTYSVKSGSLKVPGTVLADSVEKDLAAQGATGASVTCPETVVVKVGTTVTCDVSGAQGAASGTVTFSFSSNDGTIDQSSVSTS